MSSVRLLLTWLVRSLRFRYTQLRTRAKSPLATCQLPTSSHPAGGGVHHRLTGGAPRIAPPNSCSPGSCWNDLHRVVIAPLVGIADLLQRGMLFNEPFLLGGIAHPIEPLNIRIERIANLVHQFVGAVFALWRETMSTYACPSASPSQWSVQATQWRPLQQHLRNLKKCRLKTRSRSARNRGSRNVRCDAPPTSASTLSSLRWTGS